MLRTRRGRPCEATAMTFREGAQIDPNRARRGGGGTGGRIALGGGAGGLIVLVLALLFGGNPADFLGAGTTDTGTSNSGQGAGCTGGATEANTDVDCRINATAVSLDQVWGTQLTRQTGVNYTQPQVVLFTGSVSTGCGNATSEVGPFYCPADQTAYFDTSFFQVLTDRFGASGGPLAQMYVVAHEFGHHIQNQLGDLGRAQSDPSGPESGAVRVELQADCYAGIWARYAATERGPNNSEPLLQPLTQQDISDALSAAASVGDDRIQQASTGRVNPEGWTHGSSEQRQKWFASGYNTGQIAGCNTFTATDLDNPPGLR